MLLPAIPVIAGREIIWTRGDPGLMYLALGLLWEIDLDHCDIRTLMGYYLIWSVPRPSQLALLPCLLMWLTCDRTGSCIASALFVFLLLSAPVLKTGTGLPPPDNPPLQLASVVLVAAEQLQWGFYNPCQRVGKTASLQYSCLEYFYRPTEPQASICPTVLQTVLHASLVQSSVFCSDVQRSHCTGDDRQWCSVYEFPGVFICPS